MHLVAADMMITMQSLGSYGAYQVSGRAETAEGRLIVKVEEWAKVAHNTVQRYSHPNRRTSKVIVSRRRSSLFKVFLYLIGMFSL
jgi:hypothetical protein